MSSSHPLTNILRPGPHDILCGRGGGTNVHPGNIKFRKLVGIHKLRYLAAPKSDKPAVARDVVREWRSLDPPGRFLAKAAKERSEGAAGDIDGSGGGKRPSVWYDVGDKKAREKASQCLRERNGATNEAVTTLVKNVTSSGDTRPEDYAALAERVALVQQKAEAAHAYRHSESDGSGGSNGPGFNGGGGGVVAFNGGGGSPSVTPTPNAALSSNVGVGVGNANGNLSSRRRGLYRGSSNVDTIAHSGHQFPAAEFDPIPLQQLQQQQQQQQQQHHHQQMMMKRASAPDGAYQQDRSDEMNEMNADVMRSMQEQLFQQQQQQQLQEQYQQLQQQRQRQQRHCSLPVELEFPGGGAHQPFMGESATILAQQQKLQQFQQMQLNNRNNGMDNNIDMPPPTTSMNHNDNSQSSAAWIRNMYESRDQGIGSMAAGGGITDHAEIDFNHCSGSNGSGSGSGGMEQQFDFNHGTGSSESGSGSGGMEQQLLQQQQQQQQKRGSMGSMGSMGTTGERNTNAARNYLNRLHLLRQEKERKNSHSPGAPKMSNVSQQHQQQPQHVLGSDMGQLGMGSFSGQGGGGRNVADADGGDILQRLRNSKDGEEGFDIEDYQASLQDFLSHDNENKASLQDLLSNDDAYLDQYCVSSRLAKNTSASNKGNSSTGSDDLNRPVYVQLGSNLNNLSKSLKSSGDAFDGVDRPSYQSIDTLDLPLMRSTFKSVDTIDMADGSLLQSDDNLLRSDNNFDNARPSFKSVDTMSMMSIGNSLKDIMEDDQIGDEIRRSTLTSNSKYSQQSISRRSSGGEAYITSPNDLAYDDFRQAIEVSTFQHGNGTNGGGSKKVKKIDPRLAAMAVGSSYGGGRESARSAASGARNSLLSLMSTDFDGGDSDSRLSFGGMSCMSELTDFDGILPSKVKGGEH